MEGIENSIIVAKEVINDGSLQIELTEGFEPLRAFFFEASEADYPQIIKNFLQGIGSGFNSAGVIFPNDLDECDKSIDFDKVEVYDPFNSIQILKITFLKVLLDVADSLLKIKSKSSEVSSQWKEQMKKVINALWLEINWDKSL